MQPRAQASTEFVVLFAAVLGVALLAIAYIGGFSGSSGEVTQSDSAIYWSTAAPVRILSASSAYGTFCQQADTGGYEFVVQNGEPTSIAITGVRVNGQDRQFCMAGRQASSTLSLSPSSKLIAGVVTSFGAPPCTEGQRVYVEVAFSYERQGGAGSQIQNGTKKLVFVCNNGPPSTNAVLAVGGNATAGASLRIDPFSLPDGTVGTAYSASVSASGGTPPYVWSADGLPPGISFAAGALSGAPSSAGTSTVTFTVIDSKGVNDEATASLTIREAASPLTILTDSLPDGTVGTAYSAALAASGGTLPYTWSAGGLPSGLSLNSSTGAISGTPDAGTEGAYTVGAEVSDGGAQHATKDVPLYISAAPAALQIVNDSLPNGTVLEEYTALLEAVGGTLPYTWSASGLPSGLSIDPVTGVITGTPAAGTNGTHNVTVNVSDSGSESASKNFTLLINAGGCECGTLSVPNYVCTLTHNLASTGSCFTVAAANVTIDCNGFSITGGGTDYGVYSDQQGTGITDCAISGFQNGIVFVGATDGTVSGVSVGASSNGIYITIGSSGNMFENVTISGASTGVVLQAASNDNRLSSFTTSTSGVGVWLVGNSNGNTIQGFSSESASTSAIVLNSGTGNVVANSTFSAESTYAALVSAGSSNTFYGNTFISGDRAHDLLHVGATATDNAFYWNNFTDTSGRYVLDEAGSNYYSADVGGQTEGNIYENVMDGSVAVNGSAASGFGSGLYIGSSGAVPYNDSSSGGKMSGASDSAPLTPFIVPLALEITTESLNNGTVNLAYDPVAMQAVGGTLPYTWSASGLPSGLSIGPSTGVISGTPALAGDYVPSVTVTDDAGATDTKSYRVTIASPLALNTVMCYATLNFDYVQYIYQPNRRLCIATGGFPPYDYSASDLPPEVSIDPSNCYGIGAPAYLGTYVPSFTVRDSAGSVATASASLTVKGSPAIATTSLRSGTRGVFYSDFVWTTDYCSCGGIWSITSGTLPDGILFVGYRSVTEVMQLYGTPTAAGTYPITVQFTDSTTGLTASKNLSLVIYDS